MSPGACVLAIDHGTSGCKTALVTVHGRVVGFEFEPTPLLHVGEGGVEQDPADWWRALITSGRRLVAQRLVPVDDIVALCVSSTFSTTVAVDPAGQPLGNALTWMDSRGAPLVQRLMGGFPSLQGYSLANAFRFLRRAGGAPTLSGKDDIAHMLYVQHEQPGVYARADKFLGSKDYLNLRLTGRVAASFDSMTLFWASDIREIHRVRYDDGLIARLGIHRDKLPPMRAATEVLGPVLDAVADELGIRRDTPVVVGSPDLQSACVGSGAVGDFQGHVYIGTSSWLLCHVPFKKVDPFHVIASLPSSVPGRYFCANEQEVAGGCLDFLARNLLFHQNRLQDRPVPEDVYAELDAICATVDAGAHGVLFTPWLNGEKTPVDDHTLRGGLHNLSLTSNLDHVVRAVFEGVAFNSRWVLGYVERFIKRRLDPLNMIGGGARSEVWCQIFADVLNRTVRQVEDPLQGNARGAAFIAAVALGRLRFEEIPGLIRYANTFTPNPEHRRIYDDLYAEFLQLYRQNRSIYARLNRR